MAEDTKIKPHIRWMIRRDMPEAMEIDRTSYPAPWSEETFLCLLRQRNVIGMVAETEDRVVGNMIYQQRPREIFVAQFAVHPDFRRRGVGAAMSAKLLGRLDPQRRTRVVTSVRDTNLGAMLFMKAVGWRATRVAWNAFEPGVDGIDFELSILVHEETTQRKASFA
jgi:ribosomal-protein-alanine N-acetyltransferase